MCIISTRIIIVDHVVAAFRRHQPTSVRFLHPWTALHIKNLNSSFLECTGCVLVPWSIPMTRLLYNSADHLLSARHRQYAEPNPPDPQAPKPHHPDDAMAQHESHVEKSHMPHEVSAVTARRLSKPFEGSLPLSRNPRARQRYDARRVSGAHAPVEDRIFARRICVDRRRPSSWLAPASARRRPGKRSHDSDSATPLRNTDRFTTTTRGSWNPPPRATP